MARTIRFHLDEMCDSRLAAGLRLRGVDVTTSAEAGLLGVADEGHLAYALSQARVIVTHDADFLRLHVARVKHAGIVFSPIQVHSVGDMIRSVALIWEILEPAEMSNHVEFVESRKFPYSLTMRPTTQFSQRNFLDFIERDLVIGAVVQLRRAWT